MSAIEKYHGEITAHELDMLERQAAVLANSSLVPSALRKHPEDIVLIGLTARALDVPPLTGLNQIFPIEGRPVLSAQLKLALAQRVGHHVWFEQSDSETATICGRRRGERHVHRITVKKGDFTHLLQKNNWKQYPGHMLRARAVTALFSMAFTDVLLGIPPDLGIDAEAHIDEELPEEAALSDTRDDVRNTDLGGAPGEAAPDNPTGPASTGAPSEEVEEVGFDEPEAEAEADLTSAGWRSNFAIRAGELGWGDEERHAIIAMATKDRTRTSKQLRRSETGEVVRIVKALAAGDLRFVTLDDVLHIGPASPEGTEQVPLRESA